MRWDADEQWSWELLDGRSDGVKFSIEFSQIMGIERDDSGGAIVTLLDGRTYRLDDSNDVDEDNKGIFVGPLRDPSMATDEPSWRYVSWEQFREIRFQHPAVDSVEAADVGPGSPGRRP